MNEQQADQARFDTPLTGVSSREPTLAANKKVSYLESFAAELQRYGDLLNSLDNKLETVSERTPSTDSQKEIADRVHISTMVAILRRNNHRLEQSIHEIAL